ncbi:MAG TPA: alpha/beta hydrolase domain-containing protein, partial [Gammaproteobacteria bacterium]|nr:alpha/beta hydrolase domain-containing protein [Gammaproteobacteria bacterium]
PTCPSEGYGTGLLPDNPVPHTETRNAIEFHLRNWVMKNTEPPASRYPRLNGTHPTLVAATKEALGFPTIPGLPDSAPTGLISPVIDYDFGPEFDPYDATGVPTLMPPRIKQVLPMVAPRVDPDGNELGGVPIVLLDAPLGTYLGWNITAAGFHAGKLCNYAGGMVPFANTRAEREAAGDARLSLEERYGTHEGYVDAVRQAAANAVEQGFLLPPDAEQLIRRAEASNVLRP